MARLYLDHNVSLHLVPGLRSSGHDIATARDLRQTRLTDDAQFLTAARDRRILVTHNRDDFILLHDAWMAWPTAFELALPRHSGVIVLDPASHEVLQSVLDSFLTATSPDFIVNQLFWWHQRTAWSRRVAGNRWEPLTE